jgi:superfamily II DNA or RNA helicase
MLKPSKILDEYRTGNENPLKFYILCLKNSNRYDRAAGYFSSSSISQGAKGFAPFLNNEGKIRLIASPELNDDDIDAINRGYKDRDDIICDRLAKSLNIEENNLVKDRLNILAWLIANGQLEIKISIRINENGKIVRGIFHEKFGIFKDELNDMIAFTGSSNETAAGYTTNFESIDTFKSWDKNDNRRVKQKCYNFNQLWNNATNGCIVLSLPKVIKNKLINNYKSGSKQPYRDLEGYLEIDNGFNAQDIHNIRYPGFLDNGNNLYQYQKDHCKAWFQNNCQGIFEMATGTGKTITALAAAVDLFHKNSELLIIITCPNTHLVNQWDGEAKKFGFNPHLAYNNSKIWSPKIKRAIQRFKRGGLEVLCIITNNQNLFDDSNKVLFEMLSSVDSKKKLFIADEVHNLGSTKRREKLPRNCDYRIGLSATPDIYMNDIGSKVIKKYFSGVLKIEPKVDLTYAIKNGYLAGYNYYPKIVYLNNTESEQYYYYCEKISKLYPLIANNESADDSAFRRYLEKRASVLNNAENKIVSLINCLNEFDEIKKTIFFCSDKQIDSICRILNNDLHFHVKKVTCKQKEAKLRMKIFDEFDKEIIDGMVAIGVLDEGLDIPSSKSAFILSSSGNPKQFIQRRGRVLRKGENNDKIANIFDFITIPNNTIKYGNIDIVHKALEREIKRFKEFANGAKNRLEAKESIWDIASEAGITI